MTILRDVNEARGYRCEIFWCADSRAFIAIAPDLKGCAVVGATRAEAAQALTEAILDWLFVRRSTGDHDLIPQPTRSQYADPKRRL